MSLLSLIAESAYWDQVTQRVKFKGFEIPPWSRMNLPAPWNLAVRPMPNGIKVNGTVGHHFLTLEHDDTEMVNRQNLYYQWWQKRRSGLTAKKWWVDYSSFSSAMEEKTSSVDPKKSSAGVKMSGESSIVEGRVHQNENPKEAALFHGADTAAGKRQQDAFFAKMLGVDLVDTDVNSRAPKLRPTFTVKRPLLSAGVQDEENEKTLAEYNARSLDQKQSLTGLASQVHLSETAALEDEPSASTGETDTSAFISSKEDGREMKMASEKSRSESSPNKRGGPTNTVNVVMTETYLNETFDAATGVYKNETVLLTKTKSYPVVYPVRWVLCAHFHWKNRANYTGHNCDTQRYVPLTFLYFIMAGPGGK